MIMAILISAMLMAAFLKLAFVFTEIPIQGKLALFGVFNLGGWYLLPILIEQTSMETAQQELFQNIATFCLVGGVVFLIGAFVLKIKSAA